MNETEQLPKIVQIARDHLREIVIGMTNDGFTWWITTQQFSRNPSNDRWRDAQGGLF